MTFGARHHGDAQGGVDRVIHLRAAVAVAGQTDHNQVFATLAEGFVIHPAAHAQVRKKQARIFAWGRDDFRNQLAPFGRFHVDRDGFLALVHPVPKQALTVGRQRPAPCVQTAFDPVKADHLCAHLRQRHPCERNRDKGRAFDHPHAFENIHCVSSHMARACMH